MKKNLTLMTLIVSVLVISLVVVSCKKKKDETPTYPAPVTWSPDPVNGQLPTAVLPVALNDSLLNHGMHIYSGDNPKHVYGQFLSKPHILMYSTASGDTVGTEYNERFICFMENTSEDKYHVDFYGKQWDNDMNEYYEEAYRKLNLVGTGENFTCYYITEGYPNGLYAKQSTIFSGNWTESLGGLGDFQVAVLLLETSGNPNLEPVNTYRILGDGDGLAEDSAWLYKRALISDEVTVSAEDAFRMFRKK